MSKFVNLLWSHDKPWINRKVRNVNPRIWWGSVGVWRVPRSTLLKPHCFKGMASRPMACIYIHEAKKKLTLLIAKSADDENVSGSSSISFITNTRTSPFFWLRNKITKVPKIY